MANRSGFPRVPDDGNDWPTPSATKGMTVGDLLKHLASYPAHYEVELMIHPIDNELQQTVNQAARGVFCDEEAVYIEGWYPRLAGDNWTIPEGKILP